MKKISYVLSALLLVVSLAGCDQNREIAHFYPIDSLVTKQIISLTKNKARLSKQAILNHKADTTLSTPTDTTAWVEELDIFRQLDIINKPINKGRYDVNDKLYDPGSNLTVKVFSIKEAVDERSRKDMPLKYMRIYYDESPKSPRKIEAAYQESNALYENSRILTMEFQVINQQPLLTSYAVSGGQKMILGDSVTFSIKGTILID